jgi:hypothetical protein
MLSCEFNGIVAGNCVLYYFNSELTNKINKNARNGVNLCVLFVILLILFVDKIIEHTIGSYETSDFT